MCRPVEALTVDDRWPVDDFVDLRDLVRRFKIGDASSRVYHRNDTERAHCDGRSMGRREENLLDDIRPVFRLGPGKP